MIEENNCCSKPLDIELNLEPVEQCNSNNSEGSQGPAGKSAYQIAVDNGFVGTVGQWLTSLIGPQGDPGEDGQDGKSAYELWLDAGNTGTLNDFFEYLVQNIGTPETVVATVTEGGITAGDTLRIGTIADNTETLRKLLVAILNPTLEPPTFGMTSNVSALRKVGDIIPSLVLTMNLNRGAIRGATISGVWNPTALQNFRSGLPSQYRYIGLNFGGDVINNTTSTTNTANRSNYAVLQGYNTFTGTATYGAGPQPLNSSGQNFSTPLAGGTSPVQSTRFEGVYPLFGTTASITVANEQSLVSMITANNVRIDLVAETGGNKQFFDIPATWLTSRPLNDVYYFDALTNAFTITGKLSDFTITDVTHTINGVTVNYKRFTNTTPNRGALPIQLVF